MTLQEAFSSAAWLREHEAELKAPLPETWTHIENAGMELLLAIGVSLKFAGADWRSSGDLARVMGFYERIGFVLRDGYTIKRNPRSIFQA